MSSLSSVLAPTDRDFLRRVLQALSEDPTPQRVQNLRTFIGTMIQNAVAFSDLIASALDSIDTLNSFPLETWATSLYSGVAPEHGDSTQDSLQERELILVDSDPLRDTPSTLTLRTTATTDQSTVSGYASGGGDSA